MLEDAIEYPLEGERAPARLAVGGLLYLLSPLVLPGILLAGYSVAVSRSVLEGEPGPPPFEEWGRLAVDGLSVVVISALYALPGVLAGVLGAGLLVAVGVALGVDVGALGGLTLVAVALALLAGSAYSLVVAYVLPAAVVNYARTGDIGAALDLGTVGAVARDARYARAWAFAAVVLAVTDVAGGSLLVLLVGAVLLFYGHVVATYLHTRGSMAALDLRADAPGRTTEGAVGADAPPATAAGAKGTQRTVAERAGKPAPGERTDDAGVGGVTGDGAADREAPATPDAGGRALEDVAGVEPSTAASLQSAGYETVADLRAATRADLADVDDIGVARADRIKTDVGDG